MSDQRLSTEVDGRRLQLGNLDKPLFADGTTKAELISYYTALAPHLLPHLAGRTLTRVRYPDGTDTQGFFEKNLRRGAPDWIARATVDGSDTLVEYPVVDSTATLVWLANEAAIELHTFQWLLADHQVHNGDTDSPDRVDLEQVQARWLVADLDPGPGVGMDQIAAAAGVVGQAMAAGDLVPFVKTSGSKGLQVVAPIEPVPWRTVLASARALGEHLVDQWPTIFTLNQARQARAGLIYFDYLENRADRTLVSAYSVRGRPTPTVSTPLDWDELGRPDTLGWTMDQVVDRVANLGDLWESILDPAMASPLPRWPRP